MLLNRDEAENETRTPLAFLGLVVCPSMLLCLYYLPSLFLSRVPRLSLICAIYNEFSQH